MVRARGTIHTPAKGCSSGTYAALRAAEERRMPRDLTLAQLRSGKPVTVNLFRIPKPFRPDHLNPSDLVTVYPDDRIKPWVC